MSYRAGPVRNNRRQVRQTPYSRPARSAVGPTPTERTERPSWFTRIKQFLWGKPAPASEARQSEPPILLGHDDSVPQQDIEDSEYADIDSDTSTGSRIVHTSQSIGSISETPVVADGPNEALRQFFETKGDEELSNMEVVGVLSLIGQAVSRNESLVDFSQLSMDQRSDIDATASDTSVLRGLHAPPSPQLYRQGTPPPSVRKAVDRSPWSSTPRRSSIRARHSLAAAPPYRSSPATAPRPSRPSGLRNSLARESTPGRLSARAEQPRITPAASAILQALDNESSPKGRVLGSQRQSRVPQSLAGSPPNDSTAPLPSLSQSRNQALTPAAQEKKEPKKSALNGTIPASLMGQTTETSSTSNSAPLSFGKPAQPAAKSSAESAYGAANGSNSTDMVGNKVASGNGLASGGNSLAPGGSDTTSNGNSLTGGSNGGTEQPVQSAASTDAFAFEIPESTAPRELTPAEEAIVAETQSEFTF